MRLDTYIHPCINPKQALDAPLDIALKIRQASQSVSQDESTNTSKQAADNISDSNRPYINRRQPICLEL